MKVEGTKQLAAPIEVVWEVVNDPAQMAQTMPGVEGFEVQDDRHWSARVKVPLGMGGLKMSVKFEQVEERELEYAKLRAKGSGVGAMMNMETQFHLSRSGDGTEMRWEADVRIAGPVGSMGQRVLQPIVNQQVGQVLDALERQVEDAAAGRGVGAAAGAETPPQTASAGGGSAGAPEPATQGVSTETDPVPKDAGPPAASSASDEPAHVEGSSGAREALDPVPPESYEPQSEGPTTSTDD